MLSLIFLFFPLISSQISSSLFSNEEYLSNLDEKYQKCLEMAQDIAGSVEGDGTGTNEESGGGKEEKEEKKLECSHVEYLRKVIRNKETLSTPFKSLNIPLPLSLDLLDSSFSSLYSSHIITKKPFKGRMKSSVSLSVSDCAQAEDMPMDSITHDYPIKNCYSQDVNKVIPIPLIAYNSYNVRLDNSATEEDSQNGFSLNLTDHWPTIVSLDDTLNRPIEVCPLDMHMVLWGSSHDLKVRVFRSDVSSSYFSPEYGAEPFYHYLQYSLDGFSPINLPPYSETTLQSNEYLFIPNNHLVSIQNSKKKEEKEEKGEENQKSNVLKLCYFDASNVNNVRNAFEIESLVFQKTKKLFKQLNSPSDFDFTMTREPPAETMGDKFLKYPRLEDKTDKSDETTSTTGQNRRNRAGKSDHRDWQENARWNFLVTSLTIPQPPAPTLAYLGRTNLTLEWMTPYLPSATDQTKFGVNITLCSAGAVTTAVGKGLLPSTSSLDDESVEGCVVYSLERKKLREKIDLAASSIADTLLVYFQADILDLKPQSSYLARLSLIYGDSGSSPSPWTSVFVTRPLTTPSTPLGPLNATASAEFPTQITLSFTQPVDDGGADLLGYHVYSRSTEEHHYSEWVWNGIYHDESVDSKVSFDVLNLIPDTIYQFKVQSFNSIGNSSVSSLSNEEKTSSEGSPSVVVGHNHESRIASRPYKTALAKCSQDPKCSTENQPTPVTHTTARYSLATIDDNSQTISLFDLDTEKEVKFEVWDSHWSPRLFVVKGQVAWTVPPLAQDTLLFAQSSNLSHSLSPSPSLEMSSLSGKIAIIQRGQIPIVTKALNAQRNGALACVILDDGHCKEFDQGCIPGSEKKNGDRFASVDLSAPWKNVKIPVLLLRESDSFEFLRVAQLNSFEEVNTIVQNEYAKTQQNNPEL